MNIRKILVATVFAFVTLIAGCTTPAPVGSARALDAELRQQVQAAIKDEPFLAGSNITVSIKEGVVYLSGTTKRSADRSLAGSAARNVDGVVDVVNNLVN